MATSRKPIKRLLSGIMVVIFIATTIFSAFFSLWRFAFNNSEQIVTFDPYLQQVFIFTIEQATYSTLLSIVFAVILAKALYHIDFKGKALLLKLLSVTFVMPSLVVVTGLFTVYGNTGWLNQLLKWFSIEYQFSLYGLNGILLAHLFLNFPFACRICYQTLLLIPNEQRQLCEQLGLSDWLIFRYLELPALVRQILPISGLIFMLCFSSFATVLALSGGPKYTTIEVAIYQAIRDFELYQAVILSLIQLFFCIIFMLFLKKITPKHSTLLINSSKIYRIVLSPLKKYGYYFVIIVCALFICLPIMAIIFNGIFYFSISYFKPQLISALFTSLVIAFCSASLAMLLATLLLSANSKLQLWGYAKSSNILMLFGSLILAVPSMVLSAGFFILFLGMTDIPALILILVIISNSFLALPFILKNLEQPLTDLTKQYNNLCTTLDINGINYFRLIEFGALKKLFAYSFAFASIMSMGDFGIIALFGGQEVITLPYYLYEQVSHYRYQEAAFTALILFTLSFTFIYLFERVNYDPT